MSPLAHAREAVGARLVLGGQRLLRSGLDGLGILAAGRLVGGEAETLQFADMMPFDEHCAGGADFGFGHRILSQAPHEHGSPAVYEPFRQPLVQRIRQSVFDLARFFLPVCRIGKPAGTVGNEGPGADLRDAVRQRVDVAVGGIGAPHLLGHVVLVDMAEPDEIGEHRGDEVGMLGRRDLAIVGQRTGLPQTAPPASATWRGRGFRHRGRVARAPARRSPATPASALRSAPASRSSGAAHRGWKNRSVAVRHCSTFTGSKSWASILLTRSSASGSTCPVTPNVPSRRWRPARPAIWPSSAALRSRYW